MSIKKEKVVFTVIPAGKTAVDIRWDRVLKLSEQAMVRDLAEVLEDIIGVESVDLNRYSARVSIADHVITAKQAVHEIGRVIGEDFKLVPSVRLADVEFEVLMFDEEPVVIG